MADERPAPRHLSDLGKSAWRQWAWPAKRARMRLDDAPILVGPWHGEVGFEALYWTSWLSHWRTQDKIDRTRVIPITRGGAAAWYDVPMGVELYAMRSLQDLRCENWRQHAQCGFQKQYTISPFDQAVIADVAQTLNLTRYHVLHPAWMYHALGPYWCAARGLDWLNQRVKFPTITVPAIPGLPEVYTAVRFYFRATFPPNGTTVAFARETIRTIAKLQPVVVVNSGIHADDHLDYVPTDEPNVTVLSEAVPMTPENNLAVQSAVMGQAQGFVGTYGGLAQLALRMRKPVVTFYDDWHSTAITHKHLSDALALQLGVPFHVLRLRDLPLLDQLLPQVRLQMSGGLSSQGWDAKSPQDMTLASTQTGVDSPTASPMLLAAGG